MTPAGRRGRLPLSLAVAGIAAVVASLNYVTSSASRSETAAKEAAAAAIPTEPPEGTVDYRKDPDGAKRLVETLARETRGDFSKVTPAQQQFLDSMTAGNGAAMLRATYQSLLKKPGEK